MRTQEQRQFRCDIQCAEGTESSGKRAWIDVTTFGLDRETADKVMTVAEEAEARIKEILAGSGPGEDRES